MNYTEEPLTGYQATVLRALHNGPKTTAQLVDALYAADPDGGPYSASQNVRIYVFWLKRKLSGGWTIEHNPGTYQLVRR